MAGKYDGGSGVGLAQGFEIVVGVGLGYLVGKWFDNHHGTAPWGIFVGLLLGTAAGLYLLIREATRANKD